MTTESKKTPKPCELCGADLRGEERHPYTGESTHHDPDCPWYGDAHE